MRKNYGFTLIELLLVVAIIAILAGLVILAINPTKQLGDARNAQRRQDVRTILEGVYQFATDFGHIPRTITTSETEICLTGTDTASATCGSLIDLEHLTNDERYVIRIPVDPLGATTTFGTGYRILKTSNNRIIVTSAGAEESTDIIVSR